MCRLTSFLAVLSAMTILHMDSFCFSMELPDSDAHLQQRPHLGSNLDSQAVTDQEGPHLRDRRNILGDCAGLKYTDKIKLELPTIGKSAKADVQALREIHIRHNLQGYVDIVDSEGDSIEIEIEKSAGTLEEVEKISHQWSLQDTPHGKVVVLQVDYERKTTSLLTIIGGVVAVLVLFSVIIVIIWLYHKRHMEEAPPTRSRQGSQTSTSQTSPRKNRTNSGSASPATKRSVGEMSPHQRNRALASERNKPSESTQPLALPPPPRSHKALSRNLSSEEPDVPSSQTARGRGVGSPRGMYRGTMVTFTVLSVITIVSAVCNLEPQATITIRIPKGFSVDNINVFFNKEFQSRINTEKWIYKNMTYTNVLQFDVDDAKPSNNSVCFAKTLCLKADHMGLAGCDISKQQCVCSRGYHRDDEWCMDINECEESHQTCPAGVPCTNTIGSHVCNCPTGYFYKHDQCHRCSAACPDGQYEAIQCSVTQDRVCQECSSCGKAMYTVQPCGGKKDRHCIHAAHPVLITEEETFPSFIEEINRVLYIDKRRKRRVRFNWSSNVFVENLHNTRDLETIFYATAASDQQYDFWWVRESKVKVNIGLEKINIYPKYEDVDHQSDNHYMTGYRDNPHINNEWFKKIQKHHCRNPIPDFYTITLQISTDRLTKASERTCSLSDVQCLSKVTDYSQNTYIDRAINHGCSQKYNQKWKKTFPEPLQGRTNYVVCVDGATSMLEEVFNKKERPVNPIWEMPSQACTNDSQACQRCLGLSGCQHRTDAFEKVCCQEECYEQNSCKKMYRAECKRGKVICASGDAYSFTLEPHFATTDSTGKAEPSFQCHIRRQQPEILYKLWFYVSIPEIKFDSPKIYREVHPSDVDSVSHGRFQVEFIDLEHNTIIDLEDEFILVGQDDGDNKKRFNYTVFPLKTPDDYVMDRFDVKDLGDGRNYVTEVQFNEIFGYSTSSWLESNCTKDLSKFRPAQPHYRNVPQPVEVITEAVGNPYKYYMKNIDNKDPFLKFSTPANTSVLRWLFRDSGPVLLKDESLQVDLHLELDEHLWNITMSGSMSDCPGYLSVTINDREDLTELFRYDAIVTCPPHFEFSFKVPHYSSNHDKTFDVIFDDGKSLHRVFLTHVNFEELSSSKADEMIVPLEEKPGSLPVLLLCIIAVVAALVVCVSLFIYLDIAQKKAETPLDEGYYDAPGAHGNVRGTGILPSSRPPPREIGCCIALRHMSTSKMMVVIVYIAFKVLYSFAFTFSVFFTILVLCIHGDLETLIAVGKIQRNHHNETVAIQREVESHVNTEIIRQIAHARKMQVSCKEYLDEITEHLAERVDNATDREAVQNFLAQDISITAVFQERYQKAMDSYHERLDTFRTSYSKKFNDSMNYYLKKYMVYLDKAMFKNPWFIHWAHFFNVSRLEGHYELFDWDNQVTSSVSGPAVEFAEYANVEEAIQVKLWPVQFWERYDNHPETEQLNPETFSQPHCESTSMRRLLAETDNALDSVLFLYPAVDEPGSFTGKQLDYTYSVQEFLEKLNLGVLRLVFFSMDLLLLFYRFTNLYLAVRSLCLGFEEHIHLGLEELNPPEGRRVAGEGADGQSKPYSEHYIPLRDTHTAHITEDMTNLSDHEIPTPVSGHHGNGRSPSSSAQTKHKPNGNIVHLPPKASEASPQPRKPENHNASHRYITISNGINTVKTFSRVLLEGTLLPKFVLGTAILLVISIIVSTAQNCMDTENILALAGFIPDLAGVQWHIDHANHFLRTMAEQVGTAASAWYEGHVTSDLQQLQGLQQLFNQEQKRRTSNYVLEACSIRGTFFSNGSCDVHREPLTLNIPMMSCNFLPVEPLLYDGDALTVLGDTAAESYKPVVTAAQGIILLLMYGTLFVSSVMLIIHIIGVLVMYYFKIRHIFPTRPVYVVPHLVHNSNIYRSVSTREGTVLLNTATVLSGGHYDASYDTEEIDMDADCSTVASGDLVHTPQHGPRFDPARHARTVQFKHVSSLDDSDPYAQMLPQHTSSPKSLQKSHSQSATSLQVQRGNPQALTDMGYSETKV